MRWKLSVIVMKDYDFDIAVEGPVSGAFWIVGQNYIGAQRILIQADLYERLRDGLVAVKKKLKEGDPIWGRRTSHCHLRRTIGPPDGRWLRTGGFVLVHQKPGAKGVPFLTTRMRPALQMS